MKRVRRDKALPGWKTGGDSFAVTQLMAISPQAVCQD